MKKYIIPLIIIVLVVFIPSIMFGQPFDPPGGTGGGGPITDPAGVPIDGGLSLLVAAGAGYIGKKYYDHKKKKQQK